MNSPDVQLLAPWLRRFLVGYMVSEKSYSSRTRQSYRDAYRLLLPFASQFVSKPVDRLTVEDLSAECLTGSSSPWRRIADAAFGRETSGLRRYPLWRDMLQTMLLSLSNGVAR